MTIEAVIFDFYGTLTPGRSGEQQLRARTAQAAALGIDPARFDAELTATVDERFRGAGGDVAGSLAWLAARLGVEPSSDQLATAARIRLRSERGFGEPRPEAEELLRRLGGRGLRVGLVSDCSAELPQYFWELPIAEHVDAPIFSFLNGHRKPAPAIYLACCDALGVATDACLYVGDGGSDELAGAQRVGMHPVHLDVADDRDGVVYGRHAAWDGDRITALADLLPLLDTTGSSESRSGTVHCGGG